MKWLKRIAIGLGAVIVLTVAALGAFNLRPGANRMHQSVAIRRPAGQIWPWLYEPEKMKAWVSWLKEVKPEGAAAAPQTGSRAVWVMEDRNNNNELMSMTSTVESVEQERLLALAVSAGSEFTGKMTYRLSGNPDGSTLLESESSFVLGSAFFRLFTPLVMWQAGKKVDRDLEQLRTLVEASPQTGS